MSLWRESRTDDAFLGIADWQLNCVVSSRLVQISLTSALFVRCFGAFCETVHGACASYPAQSHLLIPFRCHLAGWKQRYHHPVLAGAVSSHRCFPCWYLLNDKILNCNCARDFTKSCSSNGWLTEALSKNLGKFQPQFLAKIDQRCSHLEASNKSSQNRSQSNDHSSTKSSPSLRY